jgi:hypothetical protein
LYFYFQKPTESEYLAQQQLKSDGGIDTPEITQTCEKTQRQTIDCGQLSKRYLQKLLRENNI